jgi:glycosyltransferase involved in cell wall biosynthesis
MNEHRERDGHRPKVSVCVLTYNHAPFIATALDSVLGQKVDFDYEIVVADDASTDGTQAIVREYAARHPGVVLPFLRTVNVGGSVNFTDMIRRARGEYIALLDGDDYWTAPHKLGMQVGFLDANPDYVHCFHNVELVGPDGKRRPYRDPGMREEWTLKEVLSHCGCIAPAGSYVFRRGLFGSDFPDWWLRISRTLNYGDWPLLAANAEYGKGRYFREMLGVYRIHGDGVWSRLGFPAQTETHILVIRGLLEHFDGENADVLRSLLTGQRAGLVEHHAREGRLAEAARVLALGYREAHDWRDLVTLTRVGVPALASSKIPPRMRAAIKRTVRRTTTSALT